jgi:glycosyltransferase involved in cell wall biosynthesis
MRLAINALPLTNGGGLTGLRGYVQALAALTAAPKIVVFAAHPSTIDALAELGADVVRVCMGASVAARISWQLMHLPRLLHEHKCDVLWMTNSALPRCPIPQIVHHRNLWAFESPQPFGHPESGAIKMHAIRWAARRALRASSANVFVSDYLRQAAQKCVRNLGSNNYVVPNALDSDTLSRISKDMRAREPLIAAITYANPQKDNQTLLSAFKRLRELLPAVPWKLAIVGGGNWSNWQRVARDLGIANDTIWYGALAHVDILNLLVRSHCLLFTSYFESFGNPPLEAMACGCPVVATDATAIPEVVGDAGILVSRQNAQAFAEAAAQLWVQPSLSVELRDRGRRRATNYSWKENAQLIMNVVRLVLN